MPSPRAKTFEVFGQTFTLYTFEHAGDELGLHRHDFDHASVVVAGTVLVFGPDRDLAACVGEVFLFRAGREHGIRATSDGAVVLNVTPPGVIV